MEDDKINRDYFLKKKHQQPLDTYTTEKFVRLITVLMLASEILGKTVKRLHQKNNQLFLMPENKKFNPIKVTPENEMLIFGVVTHVLKISYTLINSGSSLR